MSHFACLVIGENVEQQLAPFHEFECTGENDEYVQDIDITEKVLAEHREYSPDKPIVDYVKGDYGYEAIGLSSLPDIEGAHKYGYMRVREDGSVAQVIDRTNPNKHWDWWQVGGRWTGFFLLKPGCVGALGSPGLMTPRAQPGRADSARKGDIDFEGMRADKGEKAGADWDIVHSVIAGRPVESWKSVRDRHAGNIDAARTEYHAQAVIQDLNQNEATRRKLFESVDRFLTSREAFVQLARDGAVCTFAIIHDGKWYERGSMGWWGVVHGEKDAALWEAQFTDLMNGLSDDTLLTVVDCHI